LGLASSPEYLIKSPLRPGIRMESAYVIEPDITGVDGYAQVFLRVDIDPAIGEGNADCTPVGIVSGEES
jgi:hypothetical protein